MRRASAGCSGTFEPEGYGGSKERLPRVSVKSEVSLSRSSRWLHGGRRTVFVRHDSTRHPQSTLARENVNKKDDRVADPVCGMRIKPEKAAAKIIRLGKAYFFCTLACRRQFEAEPERYMGKSEEEA